MNDLRIQQNGLITPLNVLECPCAWEGMLQHPVAYQKLPWALVFFWRSQTYFIAKIILRLVRWATKKLISTTAIRERINKHRLEQII